MALRRHPDGRHVAAAAPSPTARTSRRGRRCCWPRTWPASARRAGPASGSSTRSGMRIGTRGKLPHGTALAVIVPEVLDFYRRHLRDRELALVGVALGVASPTEDDATGAVAAIGAMRRLPAPSRPATRRCAPSASTTRGSISSPRTPSPTPRSATRPRLPTPAEAPSDPWPPSWPDRGRSYEIAKTTVTVACTSWVPGWTGVRAASRAAAPA